MEGNKPAVLVCVTIQKTCERLIRAGSILARDLDAPLMVVHVAHENNHFLGNVNQGDALEYLFQTSKEYGAEMTVLRAQDVAQMLAEYAQKQKAGYLVLGESPRTKQDPMGFNERMALLLPNITMQIVPA